MSNSSFTTRRRGGENNYRKNSRPGSSRPQSAGGRPRRRDGGGKRRHSAARTLSHHQLINKNPVNQVEAEYQPEHTFADFGFHSALVANLTKKGYRKPTRIQDQAIPPIVAGRDLIGLANTGSGKTAAFSLPLIHKLKSQPTAGPALIITPTRELAQQIQTEFRQFAAGLGLNSTLVVGGLSIRDQINNLRREPAVVIGTPGRLTDLLKRGDLKLDRIGTLVLDEMDRMLDMGFLPDIKNLIAALPETKQSLCFGATTTPAINQLLAQLLTDPVTVSVRTSETGEHIAQDIIKVSSQEDKIRELTKMLSQEDFSKVLVFGQMKHSVQKLADRLSKMGFPAAAIHGNKSQPQRQRALDAFQRGKVNVLVATDVAARGLDIPHVSHVINFDPPNNHEEYIHRIGRTGRAGRSGQAYTFVNS